MLLLQKLFRTKRRSTQENQTKSNFFSLSSIKQYRKKAKTLTVICLSHSPLERTARILSHFNGVADEIICAVDSRVPKSEYRHLHGIVDLIAPCEINTSGNHDPHRGRVAYTYGWRNSLASSEWILEIDSDEVVSPKLLAILPSLIQANDVIQYLFPRLWLFPDFSHYINESIWSNNWALRLFRNDPAVMNFSGLIHDGLELKVPYSLIDAPIYHLDCVLTSEKQRTAKTKRYESGRKNLLTLEGLSVNDYYLPEQFSISNYKNVPETDNILINEVIAPLTGIPQKRKNIQRLRRTKYHPFASVNEIDKYWALRAIPNSAYHATIEALEMIKCIKIKESKYIMVAVTNKGTETWPMGCRYPEIRLADQWHSIKNPSIIFEGTRTVFTADVKPDMVALQYILVIAPTEPGEYFLELNIVHEHVRWFDCGIKFPITVTE